MSVWHPSQWNRFLSSLELKFNRTGLKSRPWSIQLETTTRCNLRCIQCSREKLFGKGQDLDPAVLDRVSQELLPYAQELVASYYGEPLLYPHIDRVFRIVSEHPHLSSGFYTNGLLLSESMIDRILLSGFSFINISIDGATRETYEHIRRGGSFERLCHNLEVLKRKREQWARRGGRPLALTMKVVGMRENVEETTKFVEMGHRYGFDNVLYYVNMTVDDEGLTDSALNHHKELTNRMFQAGARRARELGVTTDFWVTPFPDAVKGVKKAGAGTRKREASILEQWLPLTFRWRDFNLRSELYKNYVSAGRSSLLTLLLLGIRAGSRATPMGAYLSRRRTEPNCFGTDLCGNPWSYVSIRTDGTVMPCCFMSYPLGNLRTESFEEIWNGGRYRSLRASLVKGKYWPQCALATCNFIEGQHDEKYGYEWIDTLSLVKAKSGAQEALRVQVKNTGPMEWRSPDLEPVNFVSLGYHLLDENRDFIREGVHIPVSRSVRQGDTASFDIPLPLDLAPGIYHLRLDMVHEFVSWFKYRGQEPHEIRLEVV